MKPLPFLCKAEKYTRTDRLSSIVASMQNRQNN